MFVRAALISLAFLSSVTALKPVPLLAFSSIPYSPLDSLRTNDQSTALSALFDGDEACNFDAVIMATQQELHATHMRSCHSTLVERYRTASSSAHLPYLSYSDSPLDHAKEFAVRCNARLLRVPVDGSAGVALDMSEKHVIYIDFPSKDDVESDVVANRISEFAELFSSHLILFTGVPGISRRQHAAAPSKSFPVPDPTPSAPLPAAQYRLLTPPLILGLGLVFGLIVPLFYISITALASIKSPVTSNYKPPSVEKKNQ